MLRTTTPNAKFYIDGVQVTEAQMANRWEDRCIYLGLSDEEQNSLWIDMLLVEEGEEIRDMYLSEIGCEIIVYPFIERTDGL